MNSESPPASKTDLMSAIFRIDESTDGAFAKIGRLCRSRDLEQYDVAWESRIAHTVLAID